MESRGISLLNAVASPRQLHLLLRHLNKIWHRHVPFLPYKADHDIGKYASLEKRIGETKASRYEALFGQLARLDS